MHASFGMNRSTAMRRRFTIYPVSSDITNSFSDIPKTFSDIAYSNFAYH